MIPVRQILKLREIRNSCREFMTRNQKRIGVLEQFYWYYLVYKPSHKKGLMQLYIYKDISGSYICYGAVSVKKGREWLSGGVLPDFRGQGYGEQLFTDLIEKCKKAPYLEVLKSNKRAINLYEKLGFKTVKKEKNILIMKYAKRKN